VFVTPTASCADIAVTLAPFLVAHHHRLTITPSLDVELQSRRPSPSIAAHHRPSPRRPSPPSRHRAVLIRPPPLPRRQAVAVHRPSPASVHRRYAVNRRLSSGCLLRFLSSRRRLLSTDSGFSTRHVQPFSDARHYSLTCWEAACIVLRRI